MILAIFSKNLAVSWSFISSYLDIKVSISPLIDKINILCGHSFSQLEHKKSFGTYFILIR